MRGSNFQEVGTFPFFGRRGKGEAVCFDRITSDSLGHGPCQDKSFIPWYTLQKQVGSIRKAEMKEKLQKCPFGGKQGVHRYNKEKNFSIPFFFFLQTEYAYIMITIPSSLFCS